MKKAIQLKYDKLLEENLNMEKNSHDLLWKYDKLKSEIQEIIGDDEAYVEYKVWRIKQLLVTL